MRKFFFLIILLLPGTFQAIAQNVSFVASSEKTVAVGQQFRINYTLTTGGEKGKDIRIPDLEGLDILFGPTTTEGFSTHIVNGNASTSYTMTYTYIAIAKKEGTIKIAPASIRLGNSEYKSNELNINVLPADQVAAQSQGGGSQGNPSRSSGSGGTVSNDDVFIRAQLSKNSVYENEGFLVTFKLYYLVEVAGFENAKFPEFEGFIAQEIELPENKQMNLEHYNGKNYRTVVLKQTILYPQRSGKITIGSGKFDAVVRIRSQQRMRSIFDDWMDAYQNVKKVLVTSPVTIDVKPLPAGKPASFTGAVGDYKMTSSISTTELTANDAVTVKATISGTGNLKLLKNPDIRFPNDFDLFDPVVNTTSKVSANGVSGSRSIEYNAIPRYAGNFTIPKAEFSFFDPKSGTYKILSTEEFNLKVNPGSGGSGENAPIIASSTKEDIRLLGQDIRHIKTEGYDFHRGNFYFGTWQYWLWYLAPLLLFIVYLIIYRKQAAENSNIALVRTKKANKVASKRLKTVARLLKEKNKEAFYDETLKAVWGYLSDKLNIPVASLTKDNVEVNLSGYGAGEELIREFMDILNSAEFARFAPAQGSDAMDELYKATVSAIDKMENVLKK